MTPVWVQLIYLACAVCFILALKGLSSPKTARVDLPDSQCVRDRTSNAGDRQSSKVKWLEKQIFTVELW